MTNRSQGTQPLVSTFSATVFASLVEDTLH